VFQGTSTLGSVFLIVNAALGAGLLDFPHAFHQAGKLAVSRVVDPDPQNLSCRIRIWITIQNTDPDPGGQKWPTKIEKKVKNFQVLKCWMFSFEG
jgi:hypothetical protein